VKSVYEIHRRKFYFLFVGGFNTLLGIAAFPILYIIFPFRSHYLFLLTFSQCICVTSAFLTNKFLVFKTKGNYFIEYGKFFLFNSACFILNLAMISLFVEKYQIRPMIFQVVFSSGVMIISYFWHENITFYNQNLQVQKEK
jgi:putative flippase GtrA